MSDGPTLAEALTADKLALESELARANDLNQRQVAMIKELTTERNKWRTQFRRMSIRLAAIEKDGQVPAGLCLEAQADRDKALKALTDLTLLVAPSLVLSVTPEVVAAKAVLREAEARQ